MTAKTIVNRPAPGQKTALVTGAGAEGIGGALATELHRQGYFVFCAVRRPDKAVRLAGDGAWAVLQMDVTSTASVEEAAAQVAAATGGTLDLVVNNAGAATHRPAMDVDVDGTARGLLDVNVLGPMRVVKAFGRMVMAAEGGGGGGCVANIGSIAPTTPMAFSSVYNASKAALHAYGEALSMEMKPFGVDVVTVLTGGVKSGIVRENPSLPRDSLYLPVEKFWHRRTQMSQDPSSSETADYARDVVRVLVSRRRPVRFWAGAKSYLAWFFCTFVPLRLRLWYMARAFGLHQLNQS